LRRGDEVIALNGDKIYSFAAVMHAEEALTNGPIKPVNLSIRRGTEQFERAILAEKPLTPAESHPSFGILAWQGNTNTVLTHPGPIEQIKTSVGQIVATLGALFSSKSDIGVQQLGGAVMIIRVYTNLFDSDDGWRRVIWFSVIMNVNLALLNLLPLPVLDGGHITLATIEAIRRRPVNVKILNYIQTAFAVALIAFMLFIAFFDTGDWVRSARRDREEPIVFAPKNRAP
jgi:regulator of sigma E protease